MLLSYRVGAPHSELFLSIPVRFTNIVFLLVFFSSLYIWWFLTHLPLAPKTGVIICKQDEGACYVVAKVAQFTLKLWSQK